MSGRTGHSVWGKEDEVGAINRITPSVVLASGRLVKKGRVYDLGHVLEPGIPVHWINGHFLYSTFRSHTEMARLAKSKNKFAAMSVRLEMGDHTGTHIDGLNHVSKGMRLYNGHRAGDVTGAFGTSKVGMEKTPPIFTRGILADVAAFNGVDVLPPEHLITEKELRECLLERQAKIAEGDALLIATGWSRLWMEQNEKYSGPCPGIGMSAARWIARQGVCVVGSDTWKVEIHPGEREGVVTPVHQFMITENGIRLIENLSLEEFRKDKVTEFLFVCLPLRVKGGAGSPVTPIAVT